MKIKVSRFFARFKIAGFTYYDGIEVFNELLSGQKLSLKPEPENRHDPNAVAIFFKDKHIGYVPRAHNELIFRFFALGYDIFECYVSNVNPEEHPENQINVLVRIKRNKKS